MNLLRVGYTKGKKTKNKKVENIILQVKYRYKYSELRAMIKKQTGLTGKIHICYANKPKKKVA